MQSLTKPFFFSSVFIIYIDPMNSVEPNFSLEKKWKKNESILLCRHLICFCLEINVHERINGEWAERHHEYHGKRRFIIWWIKKEYRPLNFCTSCFNFYGNKFSAELLNCNLIQLTWLKIMFNLYDLNQHLKWTKIMFGNIVCYIISIE